MAVARRRLDLRKTLFLLPNMITLSSIFCGFDSIRLSGGAIAESNDYYRASLLLVYALFFDLIDGRVARLTKTQSAFGLQIDSLADMISFGIAPALLVYKWSLFHASTLGLVIAFAFAAAGAVRLARFNVLSMGESGAPKKPSKYIIGLPVPGAAGILVSLIVANHAIGGDLASERYVGPMMGLVAFLAFLQISTIRFRSFKDLALNARTAGLVLFAVVSSAIVSVKTKPAFVLVWLLSFYILIGLVEAVARVPHDLAKRRRQETGSEPDPSIPPASSS
ncbi:MAG: phosphatidylcholine/phosphatidylserine synthase [Polyangiaceae bacterium]|nr:phosphatidylcholine/phosphatidylserine synthase [Polyangiaceae bacterium]